MKIRPQQKGAGVGFEELYRQSGDIAREEKAKGRTVLGTLCSYAPVELLHSFGILPVRIWGQAQNIQEADSLLQPYICPSVRHLMALGMEGRYDFLDGIVHSYTCDATCGLYNIWVRNMRPAFHHLISLPYIAIGASREYAAAEFHVFIAALESFTARKYSPAALQDSLDLYAAARSLIAEAYALKAQGVPLSYVDMYYMSLGLQVLPIEAFLPRLEEFLETARGREPEEPGRRRILLSGSVLSDTGLMTFVEGHGGTIVADDTCLGYRTVWDFTTGEVGQGDDKGTGGTKARKREGTDGRGEDVGKGGDEGRIAEEGGVSVSAGEKGGGGGASGTEAVMAGGGPLIALVDRYLALTPCASRADFPSRRGYLLETLWRFGVDAVIFAHQKFCDSHLSDHPFLKGVLDEAGIPSMQLELEGESFNSQIRTRVEGFFEMIGAK